LKAGAFISKAIGFKKLIIPLKNEAYGLSAPDKLNPDKEIKHNKENGKKIGDKSNV
jgi:hypothetical protein